MATSSSSPCPICGGNSQPAFSAAEYRMYRCAECGTAFVSPSPSPEQLKRFYAAFHEQGTGWYDEVESRMQADFPIKRRLVQKFIPKGGLLLDVGCGKGFFVKDCADNGLDAQGIDLSESGVQYAAQTLGVKATCGSLHDMKEGLGLFDAVTFWATIEHLPDPKEMLKDISSVLKPGGYLFLDTGIGDDWLDRLLPGAVQWYDPPQHLFVFSERGLRNSLQSAGFQVVHFDRCFERSRFRRTLRIGRNGAIAAGMRAVSVFGRLRFGTFVFTRYPVGNLMMAIARKSLPKS